MARRFPYKPLHSRRAGALARQLWLAACFYTLCTAFTAADTSHALATDGSEQPPAAAGGYLARIQLNSPEEVEGALRRAEKLFLNGEIKSTPAPVVFVFHGPEVRIFFKQNYARYKPIVDLAARLAAFEVIEIKVCETRMGVLGRPKTALFPFVGTVPFGPAEVERLVDGEQYVYF